MSRLIRPLIVSLAALALLACAGTPQRSESQAAAPISATPTTELALQSLRKADQALTRNFVSQAGNHLSAATQTLDRLAADLPPEPLLVEIDGALARLRTDPASVDIQRMEGMTDDPDIRRTLEDARYAILAGNPDGAAARLREARIRVEQSSERLAVEQARNRTIAANDELNRGNIAGAQSLVREAMPLLRELGKQEQARERGATPAG